MPSRVILESILFAIFVIFLLIGLLYPLFNEEILKKKIFLIYHSIANIFFMLILVSGGFYAIFELTISGPIGTLGILNIVIGIIFWYLAYTLFGKKIMNDWKNYMEIKEKSKPTN